MAKADRLRTILREYHNLPEMKTKKSVAVHTCARQHLSMTPDHGPACMEICYFMGAYGCILPDVLGRQPVNAGIPVPEIRNLYGIFMAFCGIFMVFSCNFYGISYKISIFNAGLSINSYNY